MHVCVRARLFAIFRVCLLCLLAFMCVFLFVGVILLRMCVAVHVDFRRVWTWHTTRVNATQGVCRVLFVGFLV
jgi:hypothetical protein